MDRSNLVFRSVVRIIVTMLVFASVLFIPAGTIVWWRAWAFLGVTLAGMAATTLGLMHGSENLLRERLKSPVQKGQPGIDKFILLAFIFGFYLLLVVCALDKFRFHFLPEPGVFVSSCGMILYSASWAICYLAMKENSFASHVVKHQEERKHSVVDTGVYSLVRHPLYAGILPMLVGIALWLESYAAVLFSIVPMTTIIVRIFLEERFLMQKLPEYADYKQRVRYRILPFFW